MFIYCDCLSCNGKLEDSEKECYIYGDNTTFVACSINNCENNLAKRCNTLFCFLHHNDNESDESSIEYLTTAQSNVELIPKGRSKSSRSK